MQSPYIWSLVALCFAAVCQLWFVGVLLLTRHGQTLLLLSIMECIFWFWCCWAFFLRKRRGGLILAGLCLIATLTISLLLLLGLLDTSDFSLLSCRT